MIFELCTDSINGANMAKQLGAHRIELCSALSVGGLTPSTSLAKHCSAIMETYAMIRPKEGNFVYSNEEIELMLEDISILAEVGVKGVVFGCLTHDRQINIQQNISLVEAARKYELATTFHRAFDFIADPLEALESIINIGFNRLLTSGKKPTAIEGIGLIQELVNSVNGQVEIIAGSGVSATNAVALSKVGVDALHFTSHQPNPYELGMGSANQPNPEKIKSIISQFK